MNYRIRKLQKKIDKRGTLIEVLRSDKVGEFNQIYSATIKPGHSRGKHYHKKRKEWFCVLKGEGIYTIKNIKGDECEIIDFKDGEYWQIELGPKLWHEIRNTGDEDLIFVSAISDLYNPNEPDTYKFNNLTK